MRSRAPQKKKQKGHEQIKKTKTHNSIKNEFKNKCLGFLRGRFFCLFPLWSSKSLILDPIFGFYVKFPPQNRLQSSRIRHPGPKVRIFVLN